ncbi:MAG TPA: hypothetical protein VNL15_05175 [Dehalococcoidia bacterium]|nr:hypothetical protein [Dehalococcoidia bacterium]
MDRNGFRAFAERLDVALRQQDLEFFLDNVAFHGIRCKEPFAPPASCKGLPGDAIVRGIEVGIWQSEGGAIDPEQYEKFISEFLFNLAPGLSDEYGTASPRIYAFGVLREQFRRLPQGVETVEAIIIRIAGPRPYDPIVPGPENQRQALSIGLTFDSARWTIAYLAVGQPDFFLDPQSPNLRQIFQSWQRWIIE